MEITNDARQVLQFINQTQRSIFLTGKAGTGKTTLLRKIIQTTHKNTVVVAPTGIVVKRRRCYHSLHVSVAFWRFYT
ncbi:tRNA (adenosine(37)-N6)-threonylcarbamoyltransferase complex ATPase subunit type 1 TsaE [Flavobacterium piscinae]|uniref:tRNA (adenosine(37)-N6)-threonylcarbamoyltransferase complex ATPase subunit type 1 TsaE n=1 Tax=Flavobacterium piscinae TaxID=2506424 RepID=UPI002AAB5FE1|nr:tRNA (adenosine(37)-N6)-threonylcarbamoyltransferase complex ATPase subunit type 1 TsaE [Flavobacterium piscinae]